MLPAFISVWVTLFISPQTDSTLFYYEKGNQFFEKGDAYYAQAQSVYEKALNFHHETADSILGRMYFNLARCKIHFLEGDESFELLRTSTKLYERAVGPEKWEEEKHHWIWYFARAHYVERRYDSARYYFRKCLDFYQQYPSRFSDKIGLSHHELGNCVVKEWKTQEELIEALSHFKQATSTWDTLGKANIKEELATAYGNIAATYKDLGQYENALRYYEKGISESKKNGLSSTVQLANMANLLKAMGEYKRSIQAYKEAIADLSLVQNSRNISNLATTLGQLGTTYESAGQYDKALEAYQIQIDTMAGKSYFHPLAKALPIIRTGRLLGKTGKIAQAERLLRQGLSVARENRHVMFSVFASSELATVLSLQRRFQEAMEIRRLGLQIIQNQDFDRTHITNSHRVAIGKIPLHNNFQSFLIQLGELSLSQFEAQSAQSQLAQAQKDLNAAWKLSQLMEVTQLGNNQFRINMNRLVGAMIRLKQIQFEESGDSTHLEEIFIWMERNKAREIQVAQQDESAYQLAGIPEEKKQEIASISQEMAEHWRKLDEERAKQNRDPEELESLVNQYFRLGEKVDSLTSLLIAQYPSYQKIRFSNQPISLAELQPILDQEKMGLVSFYWGDSIVYRLISIGKRIQVDKIPLSEIQKQEILDLGVILSGKALRKSHPLNGYKAFEDRSVSFYQHLLAEGISMLPDSLSSLMVIPDGPINYIPLGALVAERTEPGTNWRSAPYLIHRFSFQYSFSASLFYSQSLNTTGAISQNFAGFAPSYPEGLESPLDTFDTPLIAGLIRSGTWELPEAKEEVQALEKIFPGKLYLGPKATKKAFLADAMNYGILHLAMHAWVDPERPAQTRLLFSPAKDSLNGGNLYISELSSISLPAQLVVLSACQTGIGKYRVGEGPLSIGRALTFSGVPSIVMSLWKIPDKETRALMEGFYQGLATGQQKHVALSQAKLSYLDAIQQVELAHPYFWAGFISSGNIASLEIPHQRSPWLVWVALALVGVLAGIWGYAKIRKGPQEVV